MTDKNFYIHISPHGRQIKARHKSTLMESLMGQSIFLRSDCGGKGTCGKCSVKIIPADGKPEVKKACKYIVSQNTSIEIPESSLLSSQIMSKALVSLSTKFKNRFETTHGQDCYGIAADLGTTTIALYLCKTTKGEVVSSLAIKNPQALYGDDVMNRIGAISQEKGTLEYLQTLVVKAIEWGIKELLASLDLETKLISHMTVVGNPTMIHILAGIDPRSIGIAPYQPAFYDAKTLKSENLGFDIKDISIQTLPQVSGFIGGDILGAAISADFENQPEGTLLIDLGTNGELLLKGKENLFATSCATGPAFEGASLSCGMQAISGAINSVTIKSDKDVPEYTIINPANISGLKPIGICGTGIISAVSQFCQTSIIASDGRFNTNDAIPSLQADDSGHLRYIFASEDIADGGNTIFISQKDIRSVQLGKAALITGIEFLLKEAGLDRPGKIIIAGAFGSFLDKRDMMTLGMIPHVDLNTVEVSGNSAGAGAIMVLCDTFFLKKAIQMSADIKVVDFACNQNFQDIFIEKLSFPIWNTT